MSSSSPPEPILGSDSFYNPYKLAILRLIQLFKDDVVKELELVDVKIPHTVYLAQGVHKVKEGGLLLSWYIHIVSPC